MKDCMMLSRLYRDNLVPLSPEENRPLRRRAERGETAAVEAAPLDAALPAPPPRPAWRFAS
jgi:hypothetical protein